MNKNSVYMAFLVLVLLPGCAGNMKDWSNQTFTQSKKHKDGLESIKGYVKQINMYDQLNTIGLFDALWLSDEVRHYYAIKYAEMTGKSEDETMIMLRRLYKANAHSVSFYVLVPYEIVLAVKPIEWAVFLEVDGKKYQPVFVKKCEVPTQYQPVFGKRFNPHKQPYEVKFDRYDTNGNDILHYDSAHVMRLYFATQKYIQSAQWDIPIAVQKNHNDFSEKEVNEQPEKVVEKTLVVDSTANATND